MLHTSKTAHNNATSAVKLQKSLLCGVSLIAAGIMVGPRVAHAQAVSVSTAATAQIVLEAGEQLNITGTGQVAGVGGIYNQPGNSAAFISIAPLGLVSGVTAPTYSDAILNYGSITTVNNAGTVSGLGVGIANLDYNGSVATIVNLTNSGTISGVFSAGTVTGSIAYGIENTGVIGSLSNVAGGTIYGAGTGVYNATTIAQLSNSGTIAAGKFGVVNSGTISQITNTGSIYGGRYGIGNVGSIATLTNNYSGVVNGQTATGIYNGSTISLLSNSGTISGGRVGVFNGYTSNSKTFIGNIPVLTNSGLISAGSTGIYNHTGSTISALTNSGTIFGNVYGVTNYGTITTLTNTNTGTISGRTSAGIENYGTISQLSNSGTIGGYNGIENYGNISTLSNAANANIIGTSATGVYNRGTIGLLSNSGTIYGGYRGVENRYDIGTLSNAANATIVGARFTGVYNNGTIGLLSNSGTIYGGYRGVENRYDIGTLSNAANATIVGSSFSGVYNNGTIGLLSNSGSIYGGYRGVENYGAINTLSNAANATIVGARNSGVYNRGTIGLLSNSGAIIGGNDGINNYRHYNYSSSALAGGSIAVLTNSGLISGGIYDGIFNGGLINTLTNMASGTISGGQNGLYNNGFYSGSNLVQSTIAVLTNSGLISGGTIGGIYNRGLINTLTNMASGTISGGGFGIYNDGYTSHIGGSVRNYSSTIGTLGNSGIIQGSIAGAYNAGTIGIFANNGTIAGAVAGIYNASNGKVLYSGIGRSTTTAAGSIGTLTNSGVIEATGLNVVYSSITGTIDLAGINNQGFIGGLTNNATGTIMGAQTGIANFGLINSLTNNGKIIASGSSGIQNKGLINTLTNNGFISGGSSGINNYGGSILRLTNNGNINGVSKAGVENANFNGTIGYIGTLTNAVGALIEGGNTGVYNVNGTIGLLSNSGTIYGINDSGVANGGYLGSLSNLAGGSIFGAGYGLYNTGSILSVSNSGLIDGIHAVGILNVGSIVSLTNSNLIEGYGAGVANNNPGSNISTLTNMGTIIGGHFTGIYNNGTIGLLSNSGAIMGEYVGVSNLGTISNLTNTGLIEATGATIATSGGPSVLAFLRSANTGVANYNTIGSLNNLAGGTIFGGYAGVLNNYFGTIGQLNNAGVIANGTIGGSSAAAVSNDGHIGTLSNTGLISGYYTAVYNNYAGSIGLLSNSGTIYAATNVAIVNNGTIGALTNSGLISSNLAAIVNNGTIGALANNGIIKSNYSAAIANYGTIGALTNNGVISAYAYTRAIYSSGTIGAITNTGTISGGTGIYIKNHGTTITNSGVIIGTGGTAINLEVASALILNTGSDIIGTIYGGGSGSSSTITLEGSDAMSNTFAGFTPGALTVAPGANWEADGRWTIGSVTNNGNFEGGKPGAPLDLTGNFINNGNLVVVVTPKTSSQFVVDGNVTLAGSSVTYELAPGIYGGVKDYQYLTIPVNGTIAAGTISGSFASQTITSAAAGNYSTTIVSDPSANLLISGSFTVDPVDQSIFGDQAQALAGATQDVTSDILGKATEGGSNADPACAAQSPATLANLANSNNVANASRMASTLANVFCGEGGWVAATGSLNHTDASGGAAAYDANTEGFLAGVDKPVGTAGTRLGFAVGFDHTNLTDKAGGSGNMDTTRVALYGSQPLGNFTLAATVGYGFASNSTARNSGFGSFNENNSLGIFSAGLQGSTHISLGAVDLAPAAGIKIASVESTNFSEPSSGTNGAFAVSGRTPQYTSVQPYIEARISESFLTASNVVISPDALIGYEYETDAHGVATNVQFSTGGGYQTLHSNLDQGDALISAGLSAVKNNWTLYLTYTGRIAGNWNTQTGEAGLRIKF